MGLASGAPRRRRWVVRRVVIAVLTLLLVSVLVFVATEALPGDAARAILGQSATPQQVSALRAQLGLDRPLVVQYGAWLGGLVHGDFGTSLQNQQPVSSLLGGRVVASAILVGLTAIIAVPLAIGLGGWAAVRRGRAPDRMVLGASIALTSVPEFVLGTLLIIVFATTVWPILPAVALIPPGDNPLLHPTELVLPVATLVLAVLPYLSRLVRGSMTDVLASEYVLMARLKGVPEGLLLRRHALPNALIPTVQGTALSLAYLTGGVVVIEFLFGYPGLGSALTDAIAARNLPVIQAIVLVFAAAYLCFNVLADLLTIVLTPKLRVASA